MGRAKKYYRPTIRITDNNNGTNKSSEIHLKDLLIPFISALIAVVLNQLFFVPNKKTEAAIEFRQEMLKIQMPAINRILAFTYRYELQVTKYYPQQEIIYYDPVSGKIVGNEIRNIPGDTLFVTTPSFVMDKKKRKRFEEDIQLLVSQRDLLDHNIYVALDKLLLFIDEHQLPSFDDPKQLEETEWQRQEIHEEWHRLTEDLRHVCFSKINEF